MRESPKELVVGSAGERYSAEELQQLPDQDLHRIWEEFTSSQIAPSPALQAELRRRAAAPRSVDSVKKDRETASSVQPKPPVADAEISKLAAQPLSTHWKDVLDGAPEVQHPAVPDKLFRVNSKVSAEASGQQSQGFVAVSSRVGVSRYGKDLVVGRGSQLPNFCIKCGSPAKTLLQNKMYWHSSGLILLIFIGVLPYLIAVLILRTKMDLGLPLCTAHFEKRRSLRRVALALLLVGSCLLLSCFYISDSYVPAMLGVGLLCVLVAGVVREVAGSLLKSKLIDGEKGIFTGANDLFLKQCISQRNDTTAAR